MISPDHPLASWFLVIAGTLFLVVFALPLLLMPLTWARWFGWRLPEGNNHLTVYFGRCLGAVALAIIFTAARFVSRPGPAIFDLIGWVCAGMVGVHVWGALKKAQPVSETVEIAFYAVVGVIAMWIRFNALS